jgi:hypothetical protein
MPCHPVFIATHGYTPHVLVWHELSVWRDQGLSAAVLESREIPTE